MKKLYRKIRLNKAQSGFTFFELLIVMAIFVIFSAIAMPMYKNYAQKTTDRACLSQAESLANVIIYESAVSNEITGLSPDNIIPGWDEVCNTLAIDNNGTINWMARNSGGTARNGIIVTNPDAFIAANPPASGQ
ncbi:type II secretion system protein [Halomonas aquatica]|uniref:Prepilin-type N-terminal cleavage/methylation domain-containing protein n=1 Tax=Halomonas aquatica TaxID=3151123 RepID=A0ABV1NC47_9GAMM